jgi:transaldolase
LLFCFVQAVACADAGVTLISPFVGRIYDWYQKNFPDQLITSQNDPGVKSVREIYQYYKAHGYQTIVMGASFRNVGQIEELAGCDNLTVSPDLLEILAADEGVLERKLFPDVTRATDSPVQTDEKGFRWQLNEDPMATEKLAEGIRSFALNQLQLEELVQQMAS